jgi:hypothetical protein
MLAGLAQAFRAMSVQGKTMSLQPSGRSARAIMQVALLCLAALLLRQPAHAQSVSATIQWYGVYTVSDSKSVEDPRSPTGHRLISTPIAPSSNTDQIPGRDGTRFGFSYVLNGNNGQDVQVHRVFRFPGDGMPNASTGTKTGAYEDVQTYTVGEPVLMGWSFEGAPPERILIGEWVLESWVGNQKVAAKRFTVVGP